MSESVETYLIDRSCIAHATTQAFVEQLGTQMGHNSKEKVGAADLGIKEVERVFIHGLTQNSRL